MLSIKTLLQLDCAIAGPATYITTHPSVLFVRPSSTSPTVAATQIPPSTLDAQAASVVEVDLASFLFPRIIRATASLEAALLSSPRPPSSPSRTPGEAELLWRTRQAVKLKLESFLGTIVRVFSQSAIRLEWRSKDSVAKGGLGKARQMTEDMLRLIHGKRPL